MTTDTSSNQFQVPTPTAVYTSCTFVVVFVSSSDTANVAVTGISAPTTSGSNQVFTVSSISAQTEVDVYFGFVFTDANLDGSKYTLYSKQVKIRVASALRCESNTISYTQDGHLGVPKTGLSTSNLNWV